MHCLFLDDEQRVQFVGSLVGPFLEMTLVPEPELRKATLPIFFDMMQAEQAARGNFKQVSGSDLLWVINRRDA